ncbi:diguanylate cyclase domain-containing protein [Magnetospirillum aberrantis]|uniref:Diguanylate cyclase n=1 Tax=Magnetospirillum aberrantis SpK TaxID=908842 RepID=A0A7C9UUN2_9PROT|nr:diguanylate cyclase [Magnetospirillum aberrantis]NFV79409.1 diguanylate cyclase [Magnetospirillum aberrantis SpK]
MADSGEKITRDLTIRYVAVLAVLGGLAIASFLGLARIVMDAESGTTLVSVAGGQRVLVQRIAYLATRLSALSAGEERQAAERALVDAVNQLESAHTGLLAGLPELRAPKPPSERLNALYFGPDGNVDAQVRAFAGAARAIVARFPAAPNARDLDLVAVNAAASGPLLDALERLTALYLAENDERLVRLSALHGAALVVILALLVVSAAGVFQPMVARIKADIEERAAAERGLRESEERLWKILEESPIGVSASRRADGRVLFANRRFCEIIGARREDVVGEPARNHFVDDDQRRRIIDILKVQGHIDDREVEFRRRDGTAFWSLLTLRATRVEGEGVNLAWVYDISAMKAAQERLRLTAKVVESASEAVVITNIRNQIEYVNPAFTAITEYRPEDVIGANPRMLQSGRHDADFYRDMWTEIRATGRWRGEIWNRRKSGEFYAEWLSIVAIKDDDGNPTHHIAIFSDITHRKEDEERVWRQANYDALTGLPNRALFLDRLNQTVRQSRRENKKFALMFLDLDGFKAVNDTLGHAAGDILLQQTAARLTECMRASDTVARLAGDEFTCILWGVRNHDDVAVVAAKILERLGTPFDLDGREASVCASIGIALFPEHATDGAVLLQLADAAMYSVKKSGKNNFEFVDTGSCPVSMVGVAAPEL